MLYTLFIIYLFSLHWLFCIFDITTTTTNYKTLFVYLVSFYIYCYTLVIHHSSDVEFRWINLRKCVYYFAILYTNKALRVHMMLSVGLANLLQHEKVYNLCYALVNTQIEQKSFLCVTPCSSNLQTFTNAIIPEK